LWQEVSEIDGSIRRLSRSSVQCASGTALLATFGRSLLPCRPRHKLLEDAEAAESGGEDDDRRIAAV